MAANNNTEVDPQYLEESKKFWHGFLKFSKIFIVLTIAVLLLMALFLL